MIYDCIVIGAGQSGLAAGYYLRQTGLQFIILDQNLALGGSWQHYYKSLKLFSPARYAALPGMPFPGSPDHYPLRDEVIAYLQTYAQHFKLPLLMNEHVKDVNQSADYFIVQTSVGEYHAKAIIASTGAFNTPYIPTLPDIDAFRGHILHAFNYIDSQAYHDQHVLIIGAGESAIQIAFDLAPVARVTLASRQPIRFQAQHFLGLDIHIFLHGTGYDTIPIGLWKRLTGSNRIIENSPYRAALASGNPKERRMFMRFSEHGVIWKDGQEELVDTVIFATGYRPGLDYLRSLGALDADGNPCHRGGISQYVPGLFYLGLFGQRSHASATLRGVGKDARYIVARLQKYL